MIEILYTVLIIYGIKQALSEGMILSFIRNWYLSKANEYYTDGKTLQLAALDFTTKPLFTCVYCMSSFWSIVFFCFYGLNFIDLPFHILAVCGAIYIIEQWRENLQSEEETNIEK